jgi:hypothetical protein
MLLPVMRLALTRSLASDYVLKKANVRTSMLSRGGASAGTSGSANAACSEKRVRPSVVEF